MVLDLNSAERSLERIAERTFQGYDWHTEDPKESDLNIWGEALITTADGFLKIGTWNGQEWEFTVGWCGSKEVTAWAKLPEPFKGGMK